jgi:predicted DNA-binding transcriptional regulator YafY
MRASRLVSILLLLQTHGRMTAQQLAEVLEVSVRTIYRDMDSLSGAGVPVYADAGPAGGYQLLGGYRTRLTGLTQGEAEALTLVGMPTAAAELGLGTVLASAQLKLQAALPAELRDRAAALRERFYLDAPGWYYDGDSSAYLMAVADAVWNQRRIEIRYRRWKAPTDVTRLLDPHGIVLKAGKWYLVARASHADPTQGRGPDGSHCMSTYRINQVLGLVVRDEEFTRAAGFDLAAYWASSLTEFRAGLRQGEAVLRLSPAGRQLVGQLMNSEVVGSVAATASEPDERGWITAVAPIESIAHARQEFLRIGTDLEVLEPAELRAEMTAVTRSLAALYAARRSGEPDG